MEQQPRCGKLPKKSDSRTLKMARYIDMAFLPIPPRKIDHSSLLPGNIGMMGNDKYGDCAIAAPAHMVQSWSANARREMWTIPDSAIISTYFQLSPNDQGCFMLDVLNYWRKNGIGGDLIEGYVEIGVADIAYAKLAIQYFGSAMVGLSLPHVNQYGPWLEPTGPAVANNGHAIALLSYDDDKEEFIAASWGRLMPLSYAWYRKYCDEGYACLNDVMMIIESGKSPEGFDFIGLQADLKRVNDAIANPPTPVSENTFQVTATPSGQLKVRSRDVAALIANGGFSITLGK